ncbi:GTPase-associated protein 1-related protein [Micromonospora sp. MA102]|uniref:GTPase-associated protein 1-related protein n=1 Tax=Micromonospora sp. MA102 TaxID=2952755 RepID=UPI0021C711B1|nr:GTPase-associated protein 1-related protein [Micromonospora sp. MA102]
MTGRFDTLIYTDCREGQGLLGTPGLQFQSRSARADDGAEAVVQRSLLYEPPPRWMRERRPVSAYPVSFAHVWDGLLATSAGVYLGRESVGGREGNHLTHAIVTGDPTSYGLVRPAQLFEAPFWTTEPAAGLRCPPLEAGWQPGSFGAAEAQGFVRSAPNGDILLTVLLSTLLDQAESGRRILFVAREPTEVMRWVTAVTLLLPQRVALRTGFKVFTLDPAYASQRILAVHPDWAGPAASLDNDQGYVVVDLVRHAWTPIVETAAARRWTDLFLNEDPLDVVDAVEVAAASGLPGEAGTGVALAAILRRRPGREEAGQLVTWLRDGPPSLVRRYGGGIVDLLVEAADQWPVAVLRELDRASRAVMSTNRAVAVRAALIDAERREATATGRVLPEPAPPPPDGWTGEDDGRALDAVTDALRTASPARFDLLLRLCARFRLLPPVGDLRLAVQQFVLDWADHPERPYQPQAWAGADEILRLLRQELGRRLAAEPLIADALGDQWWDVLLREPMRLDEPLDAAVVSAALRHLPPPQQYDLIDQCLHTALEAPHQVAMLNRTAAVIWTGRPISLAEAQMLCRTLPPGTPLDPRIFADLGATVLGYRSDPEFVEAVRVLVDHGLWIVPPEVGRAVDAHLALAAVLDQVRAVRPDLGMLNLASVRLPPPLVDARLPQLCDALVAAPVAAAAFTVLTHVPRLTEACARKLRAELRNNSRPAHVALAFVLVNVERQSAEMAAMIQTGTHADLDRQVRVVVARCSQKRLDEMTMQVQGVGPMWSTRWETLVRTTRRGVFRRLRPDGR